MSNSVHYYETVEVLNAKVDMFLKEKGAGLNYADAKPLLEKKGVNASKAKYTERVLHFRREVACEEKLRKRILT